MISASIISSLRHEKTGLSAERNFEQRRVATQAASLATDVDPDLVGGRRGEVRQQCSRSCGRPLGTAARREGSHGGEWAETPLKTLTGAERALESEHTPELINRGAPGRT